MEIFTDPTSVQVKYLTAFELGDDRIKLYGMPLAMSFKSELMKSMLDQLDSKVNSLAPSMKINKNSLFFIWAQLNGVDIEWPKVLQDLIDLWPLLNYFDVDYKSKLVADYFDNILGYHLKELDNEFRDDFLNKLKIINSEKYDKYSKLVNKIESDKRKRKVKMYTSWGTIYVNIDPDHPEYTYSHWETLTNSAGKKYIRTSPSQYYTFPEEVKSEEFMVMYKADSLGNKI